MGEEREDWLESLRRLPLSSWKAIHRASSFLEEWQDYDDDDDNDVDDDGVCVCV